MPKCLVAEVSGSRYKPCDDIRRVDRWHRPLIAGEVVSNESAVVENVTFSLSIAISSV